jgi:hypothetical protein
LAITLDPLVAVLFEVTVEVSLDVVVELSVSIVKNVPPIEGPSPARERNAVSCHLELDSYLREYGAKGIRVTHIESGSGGDIEAETGKATGIEGRWLCV